MNMNSLLVVLAFSLSLVFLLDVSFAQGQLVSLDLIQFEKTTILEFTNHGQEPIDNIRLWVGDEFSFASFKTESGWTGLKTSSGMLIINSTEQLLRNQSVKIGVKTSHENTEIKWRVNDKNNSSVMVGTTLTSAKDVIVKNKGILNSSTFTIIPNPVTIDSQIRVFGNSFGVDQNLGLYMDSKKIHSFTTNSEGSFVFTSKVPKEIRPGTVTFSVKDENDNMVTSKLLVRENYLQRNVNKIELVLDPMNTLIKAGDKVVFSGKATPGTQITLSVLDPSFTKITSNTTSDNMGDWQISFQTHPAKSGNYIARISDSDTAIPVILRTSLPNYIVLEHERKVYSKSDVISFNVTSTPNESIKLSLIDSSGNQIKSFTSNIPSIGIASVQFQPDYLVKGYYALFAFQNYFSDAIEFGVDSYPKNDLIFKLDKTNYRNYEVATVAILGEPSDHMKLLIVDNAQKTVFEDSITLDSDGKKTFKLSLDSFLKGSYSMILSKGNIKLTEPFTVGFSFGSTVFDVIFSTDSLIPGDKVRFFGKTTPNTALNILFVDPTGNIIRNLESFSDSSGDFFHNEMIIPENALDGRWILRVESGINSQNFGFVVDSPYTLFNVKIPEVSLTAAGYLVLIEGQYAQPNTLVNISITNPNYENEWNQQVRSNLEGEYSLLWIVPPQHIGEFVVTADDSVNTSEAQFTISE